MINSIDSKEPTYYDFLMRKEHIFLRNIYDPEILQKFENLKNIENFCESCMFFVRVSILLEEFYNEDSDIEFINH